jgi:hypothetical protein
VEVARGEEGVRPPGALARGDTANRRLSRQPRALGADTLRRDSSAAPLASADSASGRDTAQATPPALAARGEDQAEAGTRGDQTPTSSADTASARTRTTPGGEAAGAPPARAPWASVTMEDIGRNLRFDQLPPDGGVVTPVAASYQQPDQFIAEQLQCMRQWLPEWEPAKVSDPLQRVQNLLDVAAAADLYQMDAIESLVPHVVFDRLEEDYPKDQLVKMLYWIAMHPDEGAPPRLDRLGLVCLDAYGTVSMTELRVRTSIYAAKLLGRLVGFIVPE